MDIIKGGDLDNLGDDQVVDVALELDALENLRPKTADGGASPEAWAEFLQTAEAELADAASPDDAATLHYQIALVYELVYRDLATATARFQAAVEMCPNHLESVRGARRLLVEQGRAEDALPMLDAEISLTSEPARRARLQCARGRLLEEALGDRAAARVAYHTAIELAPQDLAAIRAALANARKDADWATVADLYTRAANATGDSSLRAAYFAERAALTEIRFQDPKTAAELYEAALSCDAGHPMAVRALDRIYSDRGDWALLREVLIRAAGQEGDESERAMWLYRCSRVQRLHLGDRQGALESLRHAAGAAPGNMLILEELADLHREDGNVSALADVLGQLIEVTPDPAARCALHHARGQVLAESPDSAAQALQSHREALEIDPTFLPALQALGERLVADQQWQALIDMHLAEAGGTADTPRRASAHVRVAEIYESRLDDAAEAARHYERALTLAPDHAAPFKALVRLYARAGEHQRLIELYERAVDVAPSVERKVAYLSKVGSLWEDALSNPEQAAHAYARILDLVPEDVGAINALQRVSEAAGQYRDLVKYLLREVELTTDPGLIVSLQHRAAVVLDEQLDDALAATRLLQEVLSRDPAYVPALASLGRIFHREGRWNDLYEMHRGELETITDPRRQAILLTKMGELCEHHLGSSSVAIDCYRAAVDADSAYRPGTRALSRLLLTAGEHAELVKLLETELSHQTSTVARGITLFRMAEICDRDLSQLDEAIEHCQAALVEDPDTATPARLLLENLLARAGRWQELDELLKESESDPTSTRGLRESIARADIWRDRFEDDYAAAEPLTQALANGAGLLPAAVLQEIYANLGERHRLAETNLRLVDSTDDHQARTAALREVAEYLMPQPASAGASEPAKRVEVLNRLVELDPTDIDALDRLAMASETAGDIEAQVRSLSGLATHSSRASEADSWLRLGLSLDVGGDPRSAEFFQRALAAAPKLLAAIRGTGRTALENGDAEGLAASYRREAEIRSDSVAASALLVDAARLLRDASLSPEQVLTDLESALAKCPDSPEAAQLLDGALRSAGKLERLINVMSRAAGLATAAERQAWLWLSVCQAYEQLGDQGAAIRAVRRGIEAHPVDSPCLLKLAELYSIDGQWNEAARVLEDALAADISENDRCELLLQQSDMWSDKLGKADRALACVEDAISVMPSRRDSRAKAVLLRLQLDLVDDATTTANELYSTAGTPAEQAEALVLLAAIASRLGDIGTAQQQLSQAVALVGCAPGAHGVPAAYDALRAAAEHGNNWQPAAASLVAFLKGQPAEGRIEAMLALADVYGRRMRLPKKAAELLAEQVKSDPDARLMRELVTHLSACGEFAGAARYLTLLLGAGPRDANQWRELARLCDRLERPNDAARAVQALVVIGAVESPDQRILAGAPGSAAQLVGNSLNAEVFHSVAQGGVTTTPSAQVLAALSEAIGKTLGHDLRDLGLTRRHRLQNYPDHPAQAAVARAAQVTGVKCDVFLVSGSQRMTRIGLKDPMTLVLDESIGRIPPAEQQFLVTRALALATVDLLPVAALSTAEIDRILESIRGGQDELSANLWKAQSRRARKALEAGLAAMTGQPLVPGKTLRARVLRTANRLACLVCDDVSAAANAVNRLCLEDGIDAQGARREVDALLAFWLSQPAAALRRRFGMV